MSADLSSHREGNGDYKGNCDNERAHFCTGKGNCRAEKCYHGNGKGKYWNRKCISSYEKVTVEIKRMISVTINETAGTIKK